MISLSAVVVTAVPTILLNRPSLAHTYHKQPGHSSTYHAALRVSNVQIDPRQWLWPIQKSWLRLAMNAVPVNQIKEEQYTGSGSFVDNKHNVATHNANKHTVSIIGITIPKTHLICAAVLVHKQGYKSPNA